MWNRLKCSGFSLVETLVAMGLLAAAITFGMNFIGEQGKSRGVRTKQTVHRYIAIQVTQHINSNLAFYPPIIPPTPTDKILYVGCMSKDGVLLGNKFTFKLVPSFDDHVSSAVCLPNVTAYEVRFFWLNSGSDEVLINILTLIPGTPASLAVKNFKIFAK